MSLLYENHYEQLVNSLPPIDPDSLAEMNVIIFDSVRKDYAINVSWHEDCIRGEWGVVKDIDRIENKIKLVRVDGVWWVPIEKMLQVERVQLTMIQPDQWREILHESILNGLLFKALALDAQKLNQDQLKMSYRPVLDTISMWAERKHHITNIVASLGNWEEKFTLRKRLIVFYILSL